MIDNNLLIAKRIREARLQRNLTQQDLAKKFDKTSAAISDIERGKTQITASDLIVFAELLSKPIEYFYGEDYSDSDIDDIIAVLRRLPPETRKLQLPTISMFLQMAEINYKMQKTEDKEEQLKAVKDFYELFLPYYDQMESMLDQLRDAKKNIESLIK